MNDIKVKKFSAEWCGPCRAMAKTFEKIKEMDEFKGIEFNEIDIDDYVNSDDIEKFQIKNIPTIVICDENNELLDKIVGLVSEKTLVQAINSYRNNG